MSLYKKVAVIGLSVITLQAITSLAGVNAQQSLLTTLDTDQDGLISLKEAAGHEKVFEYFMLIDTDKDGYISLGELEASELSQNN